MTVGERETVKEEEKHAEEEKEEVNVALEPVPEGVKDDEAV